MYSAVTWRGQRNKVQFELRSSSHENNQRCTAQCRGKHGRVLLWVLCWVCLFQRGPQERSERYLVKDGRGYWIEESLQSEEHVWSSDLACSFFNLTKKFKRRLLSVLEFACSFFPWVSCVTSSSSDAYCKSLPRSSQEVVLFKYFLWPNFY